MAKLSITGDQRQASDRHNLAGAVYLLSGTFTGRTGVPDAPFYWSTRAVTALGQDWQPYLGPPKVIARGMGYEPGSPGVFPEVQVPVRNLPFAHVESIVAAITDEDFRVENTEATLRVAYLKPGDDPDNFVDADWVPLVLRGFFGPPESVTLDGLLLTLFHRGVRRNFSVRWPRLPTADTMAGGAIDKKDSGRMPPVIVGIPQDWVRAPSLNLGVRGFTISGHDAGATEITFSAITAGPENLVSGNTPDTGSISGLGGYGTGTGRAGLMVHYVGPVYEVVSASFDQELQQFTVTLDSGLAASVPRGAFVQQWGSAFNPDTGVAVAASKGGNSNGLNGWFWCATGNSMRSPFGGDDTTVRYGWLFPGGEVRPIDEAVWPLTYGTIADSVNLNSEGGENIGGFDEALAYGVPVFLSRGTRASPNAPVYYDPSVNPVGVESQPEFTTRVANTATNRGDGGTGTDNDKLRDGSEETGRAFAAGDSVTVTFPDAPEPFENGDTTRSVLHIVMSTSSANGIRFTNAGGGTEFAHITPPITGVQKFAITQAMPRDFNETVRVVAPTGGGGSVFEVWWEHDLSADVENSRTQDVEITSGAGLVGPVMEFAELVVQHSRLGSLLSRIQVSGGFPEILGSGASTVDTESAPGLSGNYVVPYPTSVMRGLHMLLGTEGDVDFIDLGYYEDAHDKFKAENIRLNSVFTEDNRPSNWTELERLFGEQTRSFWFYGPSGHQVLFLETASSMEAQTVQQTFRLPGCPGANTFPGGGTVMQRTLTTELVNEVEAEWDRDWLTGKYRGFTTANNQESIGQVGLRRSDRNPFPFTLHSPWDGNDSFDVAGQVSGIAQFYADRLAFAATRFTFDTAWVAHGLDRGSIVRVSYPVTALSFRNVVCEVEQVSVSPLNAERFNIVARAVGPVQKGLEPQCTWADAFNLEQQWASVILSPYDMWKNHWTLNCPDVEAPIPTIPLGYEASGATVPVSETSDDTLTCTVPRPSNVTTSGQLMLAGIAIETTFNLDTLTPPSGWTEIAEVTDGTVTLRVYQKVAGNSEPDDYTWTGTGTSGFSSLTGTIIGLDGTSATVNLSKIASDTFTFELTLEVPSLENDEEGSALIAFAAAEVDTNAEAWTVSSEMELGAQHSGDSSNSNAVSSALAVEDNLPAGSISGRSFSNPHAGNFPLNDQTVVALIVEF